MVHRSYSSVTRRDAPMDGHRKLDNSKHVFANENLGAFLSNLFVFLITVKYVKVYGNGSL